MARSSRHRFHRSRKHTGRSDSEDEGSSRDRRQKAEEEEPVRVSDQEKKKHSSGDGIGTSNGDVSGDHGKKRKDRGESSASGGDRWNGGGGDARVRKESKKEVSETEGLDRSSKSKASGVDVKGKSSSSGNGRRREELSEQNEDSRRSEKETSRRESSGSQYRDVKEKERERERERERDREREKERERERGYEKEKKVQDSRRDKSADGRNRREDRAVKQGVEISGSQDERRNPESEKELDRLIKKRRNGSSEHDRLDGSREGDDQKTSRDSHSKDSSHQDERFKEKYREEAERDQKLRDDKRRDEQSSRTNTSERSDSRKHCRDEIRYDKKLKPLDSERDGDSHVEDHDTKLKDNRGRKRPFADTDDCSDMKGRSPKEPREDTSKNGPSSSKYNSRSDRGRLEDHHMDKVDSSMSNSLTKTSFNANAYAGKDMNRNIISRQAESDCKGLASEDSHRSGGVSRDHASMRGRETITESRSSVKARLGDGNRSDAYTMDSSSVRHRDMISRLDAHTSPHQLTEKSSSASERRSERTSIRRCLDIEEGAQRSSIAKGGRGDVSFLKDNAKDREYFKEKIKEGDASQPDHKREHAPNGPSSSRSSHSQGGSPGHLPPPPPVRHAVDGPSILGSYEDEARTQNGERRVNTRYKRGGDASGGRGPGTPWKSGPTWLSPVANGFMTPQHGRPTGFHQAIAQFPPSPLFSIRPSVDLTNTPYHMHEAGTRFAGHAPSYGWHNPLDDCSPHLQVWDGNTNVFSDESNLYGRQEWDHNRHSMGNRGWEMSSDIWHGHSKNANMEFPAFQKEHGYSQQSLPDEAWVGQNAENAHGEQVRSDPDTANAAKARLLSDSSPAKQVTESSLKPVSEGTHEHPMISLERVSVKHDDNNIFYCITYLSNLDISLDLVQPELYKQYVSLMEAGNRNVTNNASKEGQLKNNLCGLTLVAKSKQGARKDLFLTAREANFERAMSLYRKQKERVNSACFLLSANAESDYMEEEDGNIAVTKGEGEPQPMCEAEKDANSKPRDVAPVDDAEVNERDQISDGVVSVEGSEGSGAIIPECRSNLTRIHLSPESTH